MELKTKESIIITVKPNMEKKKYRVSVLIPKEDIKQSYKITRYSKYFLMYFKAKKEILEDIEVSVSRKYEITKDGLIKTNKNSRFVWDNEFYHLELLIKPKMYISRKVKKYNNRIEEENKLYYPIRCYEKPRSSCLDGNYRYKYNNIFRPYQAGGTTPK